MTLRNIMIFILLSITKFDAIVFRTLLKYPFCHNMYEESINYSMSPVYVLPLIRRLEAHLRKMFGLNVNMLCVANCVNVGRMLTMSKQDQRKCVYRINFRMVVRYISRKLAKIII